MFHNAGVVMAVFCLLLWTLPASAAEDVVTFDDPDQSALYHSLLKEYRCLKCQNQNLADSNASLAGDLRREIRDQILAGNEKGAIDDYLVARYGDFVLYRPRFGTKTAILWIAPFVLLFVAITSLVVMIRRRPARLALERRSAEKHGQNSVTAAGYESAESGFRGLDESEGPGSKAEGSDSEPDEQESVRPGSGDSQVDSNPGKNGVEPHPADRRLEKARQLLKN